MLTLLSKGVPTKLKKIFLIEDFFICHRCRHRWSTLSCEYLRKFSKKFEIALMVYSGDWGKLIHEKNQKSKISWHCPFKGTWLQNVLSIFFICHRCQRHRWSTLSCEHLSKFSKKIETALMVYSRAWRKLIHEKKPEVENLVALSLYREMTSKCIVLDFFILCSAQGTQTTYFKA